MRTTLTLDADVAAKLKAEMRRSGASFKHLVNQYLRKALNARQPEALVKPYRVKARKLGFRRGLDYIHTGELLEQIEGPMHR